MQTDRLGMSILELVLRRLQRRFENKVVGSAKTVLPNRKCHKQARGTLPEPNKVATETLPAGSCHIVHGVQVTDQRSWATDSATKTPWICLDSATKTPWRVTQQEVSSLCHIYV